MDGTSPSDAELLGEWLAHRREAAFRELVSRYAGLVHQASLRICHDDALAAETSQMVFILLARKAPSLASRTSLAGWLHHAAVMQARNLRRTHLRESRKRQSLHAAMDLHQQPSSAWNEIRPALDEAIASLPEKDREALLLHYYRSLSIGEIASLLGIATAAARKRVTRATDRLRAKLAHRGIHTSRSLSVTLAAGFALDAQSSTALPIAKLAGTSIANAASQSGTILLTAATMKTACIPPAIALLIACLWLAPKHHALSSIERKTADLENPRSQSTHSASSNISTRPRSNIAGSPAQKSIDWQLEANRLDTSRRMGLGGIGDQLGLQLSKLSPEELLEQLDILARSDIRFNLRRDLGYEVARHLAVFRDPEFALTHLIGHIHDRSDIASLLSFAISRLAEKNPEKAVAWLDLQNASGALESKRLDKSGHRDEYEKVLFNTLLGSRPEMAAARLGTLTEEQRIAIIQPYYRLDPDAATQIAFANLARQYLPEEERMKVLASQAARSPDANFQEITDFLDRIEADDAERESCVELAAISKIGNFSGNAKVTTRHFDQVRDWLRDLYPEKVNRVTGEALAGAARHERTLSLAEAAELALHYDIASGGNEVLSAFLDQEDIASKKTALRSIARHTTSETLRLEILNRLDTP